MKCIRANIKMMKDSGLELVVNVCGQGSSNVKAIKELRKRYEQDSARKNVLSEENKAIIEVDGEKIIFLFDMPHLEKGGRNNNLTKHIELDFQDGKSETDRKFMKWDNFYMAYLMDVNSSMTYRHLPKHTEYHAVESMIPKMKVSLVRHVYSRSMSKFIEMATKFDGPLMTSIGPLVWRKVPLILPTMLILQIKDSIRVMREN